MARKKRSRKSIRAKSSTKFKQKFRIGPITRNPFLNFLRDMRKAARSGMTITQLTSRGAELWRKMNSSQKKPYCELAKQASRTKRHRSRRRESRHSVSSESSVCSRRRSVSFDSRSRSRHR